jgi:hypothetical protein
VFVSPVLLNGAFDLSTGGLGRHYASTSRFGKPITYRFILDVVLLPPLLLVQARFVCSSLNIGKAHLQAPSVSECGTLVQAARDFPPRYKPNELARSQH